MDINRNISYVLYLNDSLWVSNISLIEWLRSRFKNYEKDKKTDNFSTKCKLYI